jgi:hypothetical protein
VEDLDKAIDDNIKLIPRVFISLPAARGLHRQPDVVAAAGGGDREGGTAGEGTCGCRQGVTGRHRRPVLCAA